MQLSQYITVFYCLCISAAIVSLGLMLFCCLKLRGNFRMFVAGLGVYMLADAVNILFEELSKNSAWLSALYEKNILGVTSVIYFIQAFIFAVCSFAAIRFFRKTKGFYFRQAFTMGSGAASMMLYLSFIRSNVSNIVLLSGYQKYLAGNAASLTAEEIEKTKSLAEQITSTPMYEVWLSLAEAFLIMSFIIACAFFASSAVAYPRKTFVFYAWAAYFIFLMLAFILDRYLSGVWPRVIFEAVCSAAGCLYLSRQYVPSPMRARK